MTLAALCLWGCSNAPGRPKPDSIHIDPDQNIDFGLLYGQNCAGCHGPDGKGGVAMALNDSVYLAIADDSVLRNVTTSGDGTAMPAFAKSAGGMLTDQQIDVIVQGIRKRWSKPDLLSSTNPPPYASLVSGDPTRGAEVYATYCSSCHGPGGMGGRRAGAISNGSYLALVSDQDLRTIIIVGRPELGAPDWRTDVPGKPMSAEDVSDVAAWLASLRPKFPGQPYTTALNAKGEIQ
jgi:mono/diheme cytochrome c family protein